MLSYIPTIICTVIFLAISVLQVKYLVTFKAFAINAALGNLLLAAVNLLSKSMLGYSAFTIGLSTAFGPAAVIMQLVLRFI